MGKSIPDAAVQSTLNTSLQFTSDQQKLQKLTLRKKTLNCWKLLRIDWLLSARVKQLAKSMATRFPGRFSANMATMLTDDHAAAGTIHHAYIHATICATPPNIHASNPPAVHTTTPPTIYTTIQFGINTTTEQITQYSVTNTSPTTETTQTFWMIQRE